MKTTTAASLEASDALMEHKILDHGFVRLLETMGGDQGIVQAARVSHAGTSKGEERDRRLLRYLIKHKHHSPLEHAILRFHIKCPIFVARQWFRHRIASYNEVSYRYTETTDEFYMPETWRAQDTKNKQGSVEAQRLDQERLSAAFSTSVKSAYKTYQELLEAGVAREMARMVLPVNIYTQFHWTINARSLMNFVSLRADVHAQAEIRLYAEAVAEIFSRVLPWTYSAFLEHTWDGENPKLKARKEESRR